MNATKRCDILIDSVEKIKEMLADETFTSDYLQDVLEAVRDALIVTIEHIRLEEICEKVNKGGDENVCE
jgi:hypothetical protein